LTDDRVVIQLFPSMPRGVTVTIRLIDPATVDAPPNTVVGSLIFQVEAKDVGGASLSTLPAEVNLSAHYSDFEVFSRDESQVTLVWLDPADNTWKPAPKLTVDPGSNYVAASVTGAGYYAVTIP
jgi:hypothetical protein